MNGLANVFTVPLKENYIKLLVTNSVFSSAHFEKYCRFTSNAVLNSAHFGTYLDLQRIHLKKAL